MPIIVIPGVRRVVSSAGQAVEMRTTKAKSATALRAGQTADTFTVEARAIRNRDSKQNDPQPCDDDDGDRDDDNDHDSKNDPARTHGTMLVGPRSSLNV